VHFAIGIFCHYSANVRADITVAAAAAVYFAGLIEENPELVLRMPYYLGQDVRLLDDLPIEIQNMMVLGGRGLGFLDRYWNNRLTEKSSQVQWDAGNSSSSGY
jgi:hypothetical protein